MSKNVIAALMYGTTFAFLVVAMIMQHLIFTGGVIVKDATQLFRYNFNSYSIYLAFFFISYGSEFIRHNQEYYKEMKFGLRMIRALSVMHIFALAVGVIYSDLYTILTALFLTSLALYFLYYPYYESRKGN